MKFTLRAVNGNAGALFGTVRNNVQLNLSSIDGVILGEMSGTLFGLVARDQNNPIRVDMVNSRYCVLGNIKDTCLPDPSYKRPDEDYDPGKNDQTPESEETLTEEMVLQSVRYLKAQTEVDSCCVNHTDPPKEEPTNRCVFYIDQVSVRQDCSCDAFGNCPTEGVPDESSCTRMLDTNQAFENDDPKLKIVTKFDQTSSGQKYVFGPEVNVNATKIDIEKSLVTSGVKWSLCKQGRIFSDIQIYGELDLPSGSTGGLLVLNSNNTFF